MAGRIRVRGDRFDRWGYFFVAPFVLAFLIFQVYPIIYTVFLGFTDLRGNSSEYKMVGGENFLRTSLKVQLEGYDESGASAMVTAIEAKAQEDGFSNIFPSAEMKDDGSYAVIMGNLQQQDIEDVKTIFTQLSEQESSSYKITIDSLDQEKADALVNDILGQLMLAMVQIGPNVIDSPSGNGKAVTIEGLDQAGYDEYRGILSNVGIAEDAVNGGTESVTQNVKLDTKALDDAIQIQYDGLLADDFFWKAFKNTGIIWFFNFVPQLLIALLVAIWFTDVSLNIRGSGFFKPMFYLPNLLTAASVAVLFATLFTHPNGPINQMLVQWGVSDEAINFYRSDVWTRGIVSFIQWWTWYGSTIIVLVAGITGIPTSLYESAVVDGANSRQMFFGITLPLLRPVMVYILITSLIGGMQMFDIPYLLTNRRGDPNGSIMTTSVYMYIQGFTSGRNLSYAAAISIGLFALTLVFCLALFFLLRDKDEVAARKMKRITA